MSNIVVFNSINEDDFVKTLEDAYNNYEHVIFLFDLRKLDLNLCKIMKIIPILERFRPTTNKKLVQSIIVTNNVLQKSLIEHALFFINPQKPITII